MPHIIVEATPRLGAALDFRALFSLMHRRITESGHAEFSDFKSRVHVTAHHLAGEDGEGKFVVARLATTNPRPPKVEPEYGPVPGQPDSARTAPGTRLRDPA